MNYINVHEHMIESEPEFIASMHEIGIRSYATVLENKGSKKNDIIVC